MKRLYIVTGAAGHLGNTVVRQLLKAGHTVRALRAPHDVSSALDGLSCTLYSGDICHKETLAPLFAAPPYTELIVIHCAGVVSISSKFSQKVYDVNVGGTRNIVDLCVEQGVAKLIHVSSVHAIPEKKHGQIITEVNTFESSVVEGLYAKTKAEATAYVLQQTTNGLHACVVHPSGIIGPSDYGRGHLTQMIIDYLNGGLTACVNGGYDFVDVRDVSAGIIQAVDKGEQGACYILSNQYFTVIDLLNMLATVTGKHPIKTILPMWFAKASAPLAELYYKILKQPPLYTRYSLFTLNSNANFCNNKARNTLGYCTHLMEDTLRDTVIWLQSHKRIKGIYMPQ